MFKFNEPDWLMWAWAFGLFFFVALIYDSWSLKRWKKSLGKKADFLISSYSPLKKRWHLFFQCAALICFALALARPVFGVRQQEIKQTGIEMIIALDVSNSMLAEDDKPSRLDHAKHEISHMLDELNGDRIGLIAFAGTAVLVSPMTTDHSALKMFLNALNTNSVSTQGTDFKDVIDESIRAFDKGGVEGLNGTKPTRVLLFATDGEDNEPGALTAVKKAVDQGLRVFALGFGSEKGSPIPLRDERGNLKGYKKDKAYQVVMSTPNDKFLGQLARAGGGSYYHTTFDESEIRNLTADLDRLQKADFKSKLATDFDEKFQLPLSLGLIFMFLDFLFGNRRSGAGLWRGRFEVDS